MNNNTTNGFRHCLSPAPHNQSTKRSWQKGSLSKFSYRLHLDCSRIELAVWCRPGKNTTENSSTIRVLRRRGEAIPFHSIPFHSACPSIRLMRPYLGVKSLVSLCDCVSCLDDSTSLFLVRLNNYERGTEKRRSKKKIEKIQRGKEGMGEKKDKTHL